MPVYAAHLREIIKKGIDHPDNYERPLEGFKIIVDAGNGSGGFLASDVLALLGADTTGESLFLLTPSHPACWCRMLPYCRRCCVSLFMQRHPLSLQDSAVY